MNGPNKYDQGSGPRRRSIFTRIASWWRMENALINAHCKAVCRQREADYREYMIWRGILK